MSEHHSAARATEDIKTPTVWGVCVLCECVPGSPEAGPSVAFRPSSCLLVGSGVGGRAWVINVDFKKNTLKETAAIPGTLPIQHNTSTRSVTYHSTVNSKELNVHLDTLYSEAKRKNLLLQ